MTSKENREDVEDDEVMREKCSGMEVKGKNFMV